MKSTKKNWYVCNNNGDLVGHDMSEYSADCLAAYMNEEDPSGEWEALQEGNYSE